MHDHENDDVRPVQPATQDAEGVGTENAGVSPITNKQRSDREGENEDVEPVVDAEDTGISPLTEKLPKVPSRRPKDKGTLHAPRHSILSRPSSTPWLDAKKSVNTTDRERAS